MFVLLLGIVFFLLGVLGGLFGYIRRLKKQLDVCSGRAEHYQRLYLKAREL